MTQKNEHTSREVIVPPELGQETENEDSVELKISKQNFMTFIVSRKVLFAILVGALLISVGIGLNRLVAPPIQPMQDPFLSGDNEVTTTEQQYIDTLPEVSPSIDSAATTSATVADIDVQWEDLEVKYDAREVYLISQPASGLFPELQPNEQVVVFVVKTTDNRTFGEARSVLVGEYVNVRRQSQDFPPIIQGEKLLLPGESAVVYVAFTLPKSEQQVTGLLGNLRNPYVVDVDFSQGRVTEGVFDFQKGFQPNTIESP